MSGITVFDRVDETLIVNVTDEGIVLDLYREGELIATEGMTADEWADWMEQRRGAG